MVRMVEVFCYICRFFVTNVTAMVVCSRIQLFCCLPYVLLLALCTCNEIDDVRCGAG